LSAFLNNCRFSPTAGGTTDWTYSSAVTGYQSPALANAINGRPYKYFAISADSTQWEFGEGAYNTGTGVLPRTTVLANSSGTGTSAGQSGAGTKINFSATPQVAMGVGAKEDLLSVEEANSFTATQKAQARANLGIPGRNRIINGRLEIDQRNVGVATVVATTAYGPDRWKMLGEDSLGKLTGNDATVGGGRKNGVVTCVTANNKYGIVQIIEGNNCKDLRGQSVTLTANLSVSNARLGNIKMGIIEWTGTENTLTAAMVSTWGADGVTPTLAASYAFINTPSNLGVTTTPTAYSVTATLGSTFNNLAVFIWGDDKVFTANDAFYVTDVQLELGIATPFEFRPFGSELSLCQRYFEKSYNYATAIGTATTVGEFLIYIQSVGTQSYATVGGSDRFKVPKMGTPTVTVYNPSTGTAGQIFESYGSTSITATVSAQSQAGFNCMGSIGGNTVNGFAPTWHYKAESEL
jgi:hypothetical protein